MFLYSLTRRVPETEAISEPEQSGSPAGTVGGKRICEKISGNKYGGPFTGVNGREACSAGNQGGTAINMSSLDGAAFLFSKGGSSMERRRLDYSIETPVHTVVMKKGKRR